MEYDAITQLTTNALTLCLLVSLPAVGIAAAAGLLIAFLQAITSLQDSSISHGVKFLVVTVVIVVAAPWGASAVMHFAQSVLRTVFP
ncbi:type III secretion system export apparatus subunit SctS [Trinickia caryophylli]|uniref:Type III secretion protein S n=1 Tax=Trinickia caryophylli TaxID=28094 RepID=A0A1X7D7C4_TRICW|nr:type III secretion system export apparatus subunit SctS [Trinickia caryophylli]PMS12680.1 EscS/YscS/HrcS family type III secretion system export apparatus protein [Trinickia caryophylli]TRX15086.1 EscS/YscS/HrcS family type III secretion system export apparatus protein [Trinickia caryophylli]WQE14945.1 type III secretion system export apparatus subunit SctS [Trinickia caryophylli]SMF09760.1 type III secretion protein S [Trinickia caryophylli]GLU31326.1 EscS/YscS/HrcS family type III secreti